MTEIQVGFLSIFVMLLLVQSGMHIAVALLLLSFVSVWAIKGDFQIAGSLLALSTTKSVASYSFGVIPLFVVMGMFVDISGVGRDTFEVAAQLFRSIRGGLGMATVMANAVFAAVNGTSIASASVFTRIAVPELLRLGYTPRFAVGVVAGSSVLGMLIPPSLLLILYGIIAEVSIGDLFTAGIVPGVVLAALFAIMIWILATFFPRFVMAAATSGRPAATQHPPLVLLTKMIPITLLILVVLGGIYGGIFTPTEAGAVGALGAMLLAMARRTLNLKSLWAILIETGHVTASILFLLVAAHLYATMLALSGLPDFLGTWMRESGLGFYGILWVYLVVIIVLGCILDSASIMLILLPLILPIVSGLNVDLVWFGVLTVVAIEIGLLTPPLGVAVFVVKNNLQDDRISVNDIFAGAAPFAFTMFLLVLLLIAAPKMATMLL
jgi:C4-dicarboxylate transporter, DctM subunit